LFQPRKAAFTKYRGFPVREFQNFIKTPTSLLSKRVAPFQAAKAGEVVKGWVLDREDDPEFKKLLVSEFAIGGSEEFRAADWTGACLLLR
jgi:tRNA-binding EMAP/Myf-like protein